MESTRDALLRVQLSDRREQLQSAIQLRPGSGDIVRLLQEVEAALNRLETGSYGICELCHEPVEDLHLRMDPLARVCLSHLSDAQQRAFEHDLDLAAQIQNTLLPERHLHHEGWEIAYHYEPAGPVSGDYCDIVRSGIDGRDLTVFFGDVSGKGVAASLLMSHLHAMFRSLSASPLPLPELLERANRLFCESTMSIHFATLVSSRLSPRGDIETCNAGHSTPFLLHGGKVRGVQSTGLPLGMFCNSGYGVTSAHLEPGDTLVLYTDGVTEARDMADQFFGEERLQSLLKRHASSAPAALLTGIQESLATFRGTQPASDDVTIMVVRRRG
jgi:sigma-B regulation protein RsbU (phosphoserine phosphatase)